MADFKVVFSTSMLLQSSSRRRFWVSVSEEDTIRFCANYTYFTSFQTQKKLTSRIILILEAKEIFRNIYLLTSFAELDLYIKA